MYRGLWEGEESTWDKRQWWSAFMRALPSQPRRVHHYYIMACCRRMRQGPFHIPAFSKWIIHDWRQSEYDKSVWREKGVVVTNLSWWTIGNVFWGSLASHYYTCITSWLKGGNSISSSVNPPYTTLCSLSLSLSLSQLSIKHIRRRRRYAVCISRWAPYH